MESPLQAKQVLVVRKDLNMRKGKIAAQCAHASMKVLLDQMNQASSPRGAEHVYIRSLWIEHGSALDHWLSGDFGKICVYVNSEAELDAIASSAAAAELPHALIVDQGRTEFHGVPTKTILAIGPAWATDVDKVTGHLPLL